MDLSNSRYDEVAGGRWSCPKVIHDIFCGVDKISGKELAPETRIKDAVSEHDASDWFDREGTFVNSKRGGHLTPEYGISGSS